MALPLPLTFAPMEADTAAELPAGGEWIYEPKWDGFRCLAFRDGKKVDLRSKAGKPLGRYFPVHPWRIFRLLLPYCCHRA